MGIRLLMRWTATFFCLANFMTLPAFSQQIEYFAPTGPKPAGVPMDAKAPFSSSVLANDTLYLSGVLDIDPVTRKPGADRPEQIKLVLAALAASLKAAHFEMDDLVWLQIFATDLDSFDEFSRAYAEYFNGPLPARSFIGVAGLMGGAHFELNGIAVRKNARKARMSEQ